MSSPNEFYNFLCSELCEKRINDNVTGLVSKDFLIRLINSRDHDRSASSEETEELNNSNKKNLTYGLRYVACLVFLIALLMVCFK